jgi:hypothetical protein
VSVCVLRLFLDPKRPRETNIPRLLGGRNGGKNGKRMSKFTQKTTSTIVEKVEGASS